MKKNILISIVLILSVMFTSIVYSSFNTSLQINGEAIVRSIQNIRINDVRLISHTGGAYEIYNSKYTKDTTSMFVELPANSSITYEVDITNKNTIEYLIESIEEVSNTNSNVVVTKTLNVNDIVSESGTKTFTVTLTNNTSSTEECTLVYKYGFRENLFNVTFDKRGGVGGTSSVQAAYLSNMPNISIPIRDGYTFKGYFDATNAKELTLSTLNTFNTDELSEYRVNFSGISNGWTMTTNGDKNRHIRAKIITDHDVVEVQFNDITLSQDMYSIEHVGNKYIIYIDFDITEEMVTYRIRYEYDTVYRFIDVQYVASENIDIKADYVILDEKKYYDNSGSGTMQYDLLNDTTLTAVWEPKIYTVTFDENFNYFKSNENLTLTGFDGTTNFCLGLGYFRTDNINIGDLLIFEMDVEYTDLVAGGGGVAVQGRGNVAGWSGRNYNSRYYYISGTGSTKITYSFTTDNTDFKDNAYYLFQLRTNNYTGGSLTVSNIKVIRVNSSREILYDSSFGSLPSVSMPGYSFAGWYSSPTGGTKITENSVYNVSDNTTYYGHWEPLVYNFDYTGSYQTFTATATGAYKIELWGAQGGAQYSGMVEELGGYTSGLIDLVSGNKLYVFVGEKGMTSTYTNYQGSFNGGGDAFFDDSRGYGGLGGGATDVRLYINESGAWDDFESLKSRIMVAGAAGGTGYNGGTAGGAGGGLIGYDAIKVTSNNWINAVRYGLGGTQTSPGGWGNADYVSTRTNYLHLGGFGYGGNSVGSYDGGGSGGGGYYGGAGGIVASGGGGSSFISGYSGCDAIASSSTSNNITHTGSPNHSSGMIFTSAVMIDGAGCNWSSGVAANCGINQPQPDGTTTIGHAGNGYARITYVG